MSIEEKNSGSTVANDLQYLSDYRAEFVDVLSRRLGCITCDASATSLTLRARAAMYFDAKYGRRRKVSQELRSPALIGPISRGHLTLVSSRD